uniref:Uncharacterized protein n=1 Tax=Candidatus Methanogaster sp. ANME-2c ERB4 TaxID=2759911 RepID=A0A7G9YEH8_9EURY|nr:hypothetical protein NIBJONLA_00029 [Methanosarcinales archaeon ANME-2c ERB4]
MSGGKSSQKLVGVTTATPANRLDGTSPAHSRPPPVHTRICPPHPVCTYTTPPGGASAHAMSQMPPPPGSPAVSTHRMNGRRGDEEPTHRKFYNETDVIKSMESMPEKRIVLTIDPNELKEGVCKIYPSKDERFAVCLEDEKIKIFPIEE